MIEIGGQVYALDNPVLWGGAGLVLLVLILLWLAVRGANRSAAAVAPLAQQMAIQSALQGYRYLVQQHRLLELGPEPGAVALEALEPTS